MKKHVLIFSVIVSSFLLVACGGGEGADASKVDLGGTFNLENTAVTANYLLDGWVHPSNQFDGADEGNKAVVLNLTAKNSGTEEFSELSTNFSLSFGGEVVEATNYVGITDDSGLNNCGATLAAPAGGETTCDLVFEVPDGTDVSNPSLVFEPLFGDESAQTFLLK